MECAPCKEDISTFHLQRWWEKSGPCYGTLAKGFQTRCLLKILDGCRFSSLEEVGEVSLEKMKIVDGCHFSSLQEVGEASLEKMVTPEKM